MADFQLVRCSYVFLTPAVACSDGLRASALPAPAPDPFQPLPRLVRAEQILGRLEELPSHTDARVTSFKQRAQENRTR